MPNQTFSHVFGDRKTCIPCCKHVVKSMTQIIKYMCVKCNIYIYIYIHLFDPYIVIWNVEPLFHVPRCKNVIPIVQAWEQSLHLLHDYGRFYGLEPQSKVRHHIPFKPFLLQVPQRFCILNKVSHHQHLTSGHDIAKRACVALFYPFLNFLLVWQDSTL